MGDLIVRVDDVTVFDHKKDGGFPGNDELLRRISTAGAPRPAI